MWVANPGPAQTSLKHKLSPDSELHQDVPQRPKVDNPRKMQNSGSRKLEGEDDPVAKLSNADTSFYLQPVGPGTGPKALHGAEHLGKSVREESVQPQLIVLNSNHTWPLTHTCPCFPARPIHYIVTQSLFLDSFLSFTLYPTCDLGGLAELPARTRSCTHFFSQNLWGDRQILEIFFNSVFVILKRQNHRSTPSLLIPGLKSSRSTSCSPVRIQPLPRPGPFLLWVREQHPTSPPYLWTCPPSPPPAC